MSQGQLIVMKPIYMITQPLGWTVLLLDLVFSNSLNMNAQYLWNLTCMLVHELHESDGQCGT